MYELCRAQHRQQVSAPSPSSDDEWLESLCRVRPSMASPTMVAPGELQQQKFATAQVEKPDGGPSPRSGEASKGMGGPSPPPAQNTTASSVSIGKPSSLSTHTPPAAMQDSTIFVGPFRSLGSLVDELAVAGMCLPSPPWRVPPHGEIPRVASNDGMNPGTVVGHCLWRVAAWLSALEVAVFKIGIAHDPVHR